MTYSIEFLKAQSGTHENANTPSDASTLLVARFTQWVSREPFHERVWGDVSPRRHFPGLLLPLGFPTCPAKL